VPGAAEDANTCARRVFDKACAAKEPYACGMLGRMTITHAQDAAELARGRAQLQRACDELGGPPCKMLANHLETGELGTFGRPRCGAAHPGAKAAMRARATISPARRARRPGTG
jgi:hypothetical protein